MTETSIAPSPNQMKALLAQSEALRARIDRAGNISEDERIWYYSILEEADLTWSEKEKKVQAYLEMALKRTQIVEMTPLEHKDKVYDQVTKMIGSYSLQRNQKGPRLEQMHQALNGFWGIQDVIQNGVRRLGFFPDGFEARIWDRFQTMYMAQGRNLLDPEGIRQFERSIGKTFDHLARIAEHQEKMRARVAREKFFMTKDKKTGKSMREVVLRQFESQMYHWLDNALSLRDWSKAFSDLVQKQMPDQLKAFNENYHQVYSHEFWRFQKSFSPQEFPNFTSTFNFSTEADFLHGFTMKEIKVKTKEVHKALVADSDELLGSFFNKSDRDKWKSKMKAIKSPKLSQAMKLLSEIKREREKKERLATTEAKVLETFDKRRFVLEGFKASKEIKKRFGDGTFLALGIDYLATSLEARAARIESLKAELKKAKGYEAQYEIQQQLLDLDATFYFPDNSPGAREHKIAQLKEQFEMYLNAKNFTAARNIASKLKKYDAVESYNLFKKLELEQHKHEGGLEKKSKENTEEEKDTKVETSHDKLMKIRFFERCIEHAEKVKEACVQVGIPTDDPAYWGQEGVRNRVGWLKKNGLYHIYEKYNSSDPNIPKDAQAGGFRFRWLDGRGSDLSGAKAEQGMKYLDRYKESGYMLCALAGAFSIRWKGSSDPTYCPDDFITKMRDEMTKI